MRRLRHSVVHHLSLHRIRRRRQQVKLIKQRQRERRSVFFIQESESH